MRADLVARAAAFLLLNDSKSSFAIEGEKPSGTRAARWGQAIAEAGSRPLSLAEFDRLQRIVIGDQRRSEEHTSELQSLMRISYAVFCLNKKQRKTIARHRATTTSNRN